MPDIVSSEERQLLSAERNSMRDDACMATEQYPDGKKVMRVQFYRNSKMNCSGIPTDTKYFGEAEARRV